MSEPWKSKAGRVGRDTPDVPRNDTDNPAAVMSNMDIDAKFKPEVTPRDGFGQALASLPPTPNSHLSTILRIRKGRKH